MNRKMTVGNEKIACIFDAGTFVELGAYIKRNGENDTYNGVICGYGSVSGKLAFAFVQDSDRLKGAFDCIGAKKIEMLYDMAVKNGAPVIGVFNSAGAVVLDGSEALSAYGRFMSCVSKASGIIPQIAIIDGICTGMALTAASMFDMALSIEGKSVTYMTADSGKEKAIKLAKKCENETQAYEFARELVQILPGNNRDNPAVMSGDDAGRAVAIDGLTGASLVKALCDNGSYTELYAEMGKCVSVGLAFFGGELCGVVCTNKESKKGGKLCGCGAKKAADFISFCDRFGIGVLTLVDSQGIADSEQSEAFGALASAYISASVPKVTLITGKGYGASFTLLGSKSLGADVAIALEGSTISVMSPETAVAFIMNSEISAEKSRSDVEAEWCEKYASAERAAEKGDIDDIIPAEEARARICSALYMLSEKSEGITRKYAKTPLC